MKLNSSIIYINFAPYDNAGKILDYLIEHFELVIHFSFSFHKLNKRNCSNIIHVYKDKKLIRTIPFIHIHVSEVWIVWTLPIRVILIAGVTFLYILLFQKDYGTFSYYLTVNAYTAWLGSLYKRFGLLKKTIFWIWDYYPPNNPDWKIRFISLPYRSIDRLATKSSDKVFFLSKRLAELRRNEGIIQGYTDEMIIPIGTHPQLSKQKKSMTIGHFGVLKKHQGLDFLFDNLNRIYQEYPKLTVEIIGSGPDEDHFKSRASIFGSKVKFYGFVENEVKLKNIMKNWRVGLALYKPGENTVSYWTDPSKIKYYISHGIPVITTDVVAFTKEVSHYKAGIILTYGDEKALQKGISRIFDDYRRYSANAYKLAKKYDYQDLYSHFLSRGKYTYV